MRTLVSCYDTTRADNRAGRCRRRSLRSLGTAAVVLANAEHDVDATAGELVQAASTLMRGVFARRRAVRLGGLSRSATSEVAHLSSRRWPCCRRGSIPEV